MKNVAKEAAKDAFEYASASMAYGEGAGIRRRHIESAVNYKASVLPGYSEAFTKASEKIDVSKTIEVAKRSGKTRDVAGFANKNIKAAARGDLHHMSTPLIVGLVIAGVAHQTGYDRRIIAYTRRKSGDVRAWLKRKL